MLVLLALLPLGAALASAQEPESSRVQALVPAAADPLSNAHPPFAVLLVRSNDRENSHRAALGDHITLQVQDLRELLESVPCKDLVLFLGGMAIAGSPPQSCNPWAGGGSGFVTYQLDRTAESDKAWHTLLQQPTALNRTISISLGPTESISYPTAERQFQLQVLPAAELYGYLAVLIVVLACSLWLAARTPLLRSRAPEAAVGGKAPYSLARFQLAFWSFLVIAAYIFIWMITAELDTITGSVLALLGIGAGTALGAAVIDQSPAAPADPGTAPVPREPQVSRGFLRDILSDDRGLSLYRFQLFAWTLVLGVIFCESVYDGLQMPQFSPTLLGLMGISSGTYLGFKVPEKQAGQRAAE
jgi:hypothetical protein